MNKDKNVVLDNASEYYVRVLNAIAMIKSGSAETDACKANNLDVNTFRNQTLYLKKKDYTPAYEIPNDVHIISSGYERLFCFIMERVCDLRDKNHKKDWSIKELDFGLEGVYVPKGKFIPENVEERIKEAIKELSIREREVIKLRGICGLTHEETGKRLGVTRERIRQIEAKAIRKLRHPSRYKKLVYGDLHTSIDEQMEKAYKEEKEKIIGNLTARYNNKLNDDMANFALSIVENVLESKDIPIPNDPLDDDISELDLSVRSYNCLVRYGAKTIRDVANMTMDDFYRVRNLGRKSTDEIIKAMRIKYGIVIRG